MANKHALIICPHFPPVNAVDMHRVRMSLPYFKQLGWDITILSVHEDYVHFPRDPILVETVPDDTRQIRVRGSKRWPGINSLALRAIWPIYRKGSELLKKEKFDLVYFSTTMFPLPVLGYFWKKRFGVPYIIDMQDPWYSTYYDNKPRSERPPKHWLSNRLHKYAEPIAMKHAGGIISVSASYITDLAGRYPNLKKIPTGIIPFSASSIDVDTAMKHHANYTLQFDPADGHKHLIYIGRAGHIMRRSLEQLFTAFRRGLENSPQLFSNFKMHFIGTDYATGSQARASVLPLAEKFGLSSIVTETTERIPFFSVTAHLKKGDGILIPGSDHAGYTPSKIYPYLILEKPVLGIFHEQSPVVDILNKHRNNSVSTLGEDTEKTLKTLTDFLIRAASDEPERNTGLIWEASAMAKEQVKLFNKVISEQH